MRRTVIVLVLFVLAFVGHQAWPIYTLGQLARAVEARNIPAAMSHIDVPSVRGSLVRQVMETYLKLTGKVTSPLLSGIVVEAAGTIADPIIAEMIGPEALTDLLRTGWPSNVLPEQPSGTIGLTKANLGSAWQIYSESRYGIRRFELELPPSAARDRRFGIELRLISWRWRLVSVRLPEQLRIQLAQMLIKREAKR